jgi:hypothetical protein
MSRHSGSYSIIQLLALTALGCLLACGGGGGGSSACTAGDIQSCLCPGGAPSHRVCTDQGIFTPCACQAAEVSQPEEALEVAELAEVTPEQAEGDAAEALEGEVPGEAEEAGPDALEVLPEAECVAACGERECGDDGCGGSCGSCGCGEACQAGVCVFTACDGRACGPDGGGCGHQCGGCYEFALVQCVTTAQGAECGCSPACGGKQCGDDGCGGSCGACGGLKCNSIGKCVTDCTPDCTGKPCGDNGCGGICGACLAGTHCGPDQQCYPCLSNSHCQPPLVCVTRTCVPVVPE